jgi:LysM repeat protein
VLEQAEIRPPNGDPIEVMFNPTQYELEGSFGIEEKPVIGQRTVIQFTGGAARTLSMELFFDTYEKGTDVSKRTDRVYNLTEVDPKVHRPPIVTFAWGNLTFVCVVQRVAGRFTLFLESGIPVRATLTVTFKEYTDPAAQPRNVKTQSADHTKTYVIKRGDSLSSIAAAEYGDATSWRPIAASNAIDNPRLLASGQRIVIPPLPSRKGSA